MRRLSRIVQEWRDRVLPPPSGRHAAALAPEPAPEVEALAEPPATHPIPVLPLYERRRIVPPWAPPAARSIGWYCMNCWTWRPDGSQPCPNCGRRAQAPADDGLDDLRDAVLRLMDVRPDLAHPAPAAGADRELAVR